VTGGTAAGVAAALACAWISGDAIGRGRPGRALTAWADWQVVTAPRRSASFWAGAVVVATVACVLIALRPRRSIRNWRAWRERDRRRALAAQTPFRLAGEDGFATTDHE
jgi:hypothetical protein